MTDITFDDIPSTVRTFDKTSAAAAARVRARYRAEGRFKAYGLAALLVTGLFLATLLINIVWKGLPAFWQHTLVLDVPVAKETVDPEGKGDPKAIRAADYYPMTLVALKSVIPGIESRSQERQLGALLSDGAADELRDALVAKPDLVGQTVKARLLLSADADLYYKNPSTPILSSPSHGVATLSGMSGTVSILTSANDFTDALIRVKQGLKKRAAEAGALARRYESRGTPEDLAQATALRETAAGLLARYDNPGLDEPLDNKMPSLLFAINGGLVKATTISDKGITGEALLPLSSAAEAQPGAWSVVVYETPEANRNQSDQDVAFLERLRDQGKVENGFHWRFFTAGSSGEAELAGVWGAVVGTAMTLFVTLLLCLPIGVGAAVYLEEFAPKNRWTDVIEVNINNLAAVPSIIFGLLGLAIFINFFGMTRSTALVAGLVLALLVLPTIIIASRAALRAVPPSIKEAALGVGASHQQAVFHHVLPLAMPGIMTGTIIGMAHALGETAPLLSIGLIAFIAGVPEGFLEGAPVLPAQIFIWADLPGDAFKAKTAAAIMVLLMFLLVMNGAAIWLRKKFERRW